VVVAEVRLAEDDDDDDATAGVVALEDVNCNLSTPPFQLKPW